MRSLATGSRSRNVDFSDGIMAMSRAVAVVDFQPGDEAPPEDGRPRTPSEMLRFRAGDEIEILSEGPEGWAVGRVKGQRNPWRTGAFPTGRTTHGATAAWGVGRASGGGGKPQARPTPAQGQELHGEAFRSQWLTGAEREEEGQAPLEPSDETDDEDDGGISTVAELRQLRKELLSIDPQIDMCTESITNTLGCANAREVHG